MESPFRPASPGVVARPLADIKRAGASLGGSVNDVFVTGAVNAVLAYHEAQGAAIDTLTFSFVVSQRQGGGTGGNFFTPVRVHLPVAPASTPLAWRRSATPWLPGASPCNPADPWPVWPACPGSSTPSRHRC